MGGWYEYSAVQIRWIDTDTPEIKLSGFCVFFHESIEAAEKCTPFSYSRRNTNCVESQSAVLVSSQCICWVRT